MIEADDFLDPARKAGIDFFTGVPCSFLTPVINRVISRPDLAYVGAASEGEAVGIAAGAWLAGRRTAVMCQNSGLGNAVNPLTSLNHPFDIPTLFITTWRGEPGLGDEPQHELMGQITSRLFQTMQIASRSFPKTAEATGPAIADAIASMDRFNRPFAFIMAKGTVADNDLDQLPMARRANCERADLSDGGDSPTRAGALERLLGIVPDNAAIIATTGKCGRELFTLADRPQHLYMVGAMGCASGVGLGTSLNTERPVIVLDGDGAALMKLGSLATIGAYGRSNLIHVVLDNGVHDSTGGQATVSPVVDFAIAAQACNYGLSLTTDSAASFEAAMKQALSRLANPGPTLIHLRIRPGSLNPLGRPTVKPRDVARRFRDFVTAG
ncbi:MAG: phosphonopyruvate decarboxylase [Rhodospirillales bacterium]